MNMDLTFLTNEPGRTLSDRLGKILKTDTQYFDCLVGYFYISGFYRLYRSMENVDRIRILVGINTDPKMYDLIQDGKNQRKLNLPSHAEAIERSSKDLLAELEANADQAPVEEGINYFVEWIRSGKLEIRAFPSGDLHAKVYILTFREGGLDRGRVITGSSNLTEAGLQTHLEFNVELKNVSDYDFAFGKFNELWAQAVDIAKPFDKLINLESPYAPFTPYELYLKFLYEYFRDDINRSDDPDDIYVPTGYMKLRYQQDAVLNARRILDEYGGVFLSDVVGLGKTYMAAMLAKQLDGRHLVIAPPHLLREEERGSWPNVFREFQVRQTKFESVGRLDHLLDEDLDKYLNVFIDESHRFRTEETQSYDMLSRICRGKRVILVSATPLNNRPGDILSQVKLFQDGKSSTLPNLKNLDKFFRGLDMRLRGLDRQRDKDDYIHAVQQNAKDTREQVLKYLMVRRTRSEVAKYYADDLRVQGMRFPEVRDPEPLFYQFSKLESQIFDETVQRLGSGFQYARYKPLLYYNGKRSEQELQGQRNMVRFMKILMIKRLESSFTAFRLTLDRFIHSYERTIAEFRKGHLYLSKDYIHKIYEALESDDEEYVENLLQEEKAERLDATKFNKEFLEDLTSDYKLLVKIKETWAPVRRDPKWESFKNILTKRKDLSRCKIIIFTESQETAEYLAKRIREEVEPRVLMVSAGSSEPDQRAVTQNFDKNSKNPRDDYRILVTTEVLAEGVNLHRSNIVVNYDIPWNPTRIIQRVGRVNRVDTEFDFIQTYNFFPTDESNDQIKLTEAAVAKLHAFIEMLGADARMLTEQEEVKSHDLFTRMNSRKTITGEEESEESELEYLQEIRRIRDTQPDLFARIKKLPKKARSTRMLRKDQIPSADYIPALLTYFRKRALDKFYLASPGKPHAEELDFFSAAKLLKPSDPSEPRKPIPENFYGLLDVNKTAFHTATDPVREEELPARQGSSTDAYILRRLKAVEIRRYQGFTETDEEFIKEVIEAFADGRVPKHAAKLAAEQLKMEKDPLRVLGIIRRQISRYHLKKSMARQRQSADAPGEIILSSSLREAE